MQPVLLYDGECRFCRFVARGIVRLDRPETVAVLPFDDPTAQGLLAAIPQADRETSWHLVQDGGRASGGAGVSELLGILPATRPLAPVLRRLPLAGIYGFVSRRRSRLGRFVPDGPAPRRPR